MPNSNFGNIQYKASNGLIKLDELEGIVECFVSGIGNKDSVGDICATGAFAKSLQRRKPRVVWGHNWNDPIGKVLEIYEVPASDPRLPMKMKMAGIGGLYAKVQFNLQSEKGKEAFANVAFFGEEQEWSIGYKTLRAQYDDNLQANVLYEVELYEVSPVLHGANQLTGTISVKSDEEKMHGMMPLVIGAPSAPAPRRDGIFDEGMSQTISGPQLAGVVAELSRRAGGPVMVVNATENSVVFVKPGKGKFRIGYHFTGSEYMFGKPELIQADQPKPQMQSGPSPVPGITAKPTAGQKPVTMNPAMPMPVAVKPGNGGMIMVPLPQVEYEGMDKDKKPELVAEERELAESLVRIAGKYGKFDEDGDGIWAGYYPPAENKVKDIGVKCSNCVLYQGEGKCKILDLKVEDEGKCRFAIIPDGVVVGYGKKEYNDILDDEEIKMVEDIEAKYPGEFILGALRNTVKKRRKKRRSYKTLEEWGVEEQELMEKGLDPFLAQDASYVLPVDPADAFEFKSMIDPVLEYHRIDTYVNEYGVVIASQLDQEAKDAISNATASAYAFLKKKIASEKIEEKALGRRIGRAIASRGIDRPNLGGKRGRRSRGSGINPPPGWDPRTVEDANLNSMVGDGTPWEQPDPTPSGPGSINSPKPSKRQMRQRADLADTEKLSSGKRNERRHADRSADMEKQFPNAEENQKRMDHEAIAKAWDEQGLGWEEVPRYNADKNFSSDYLRGREIGVNQARVMWNGDSVRKRPEKFNEKQKASNEYSNWYSSYAKSVSAYLDAHSRDDSDNWDGIESALRADVKSKYPDTQDWAKEDIATLNEYLNDIGLLDVDKLKKKKKKKAGTETEKGPDLQELRKLNSEGKLSSGRTRDPVNGGFLRETDYNDEDSGYGLVPKLMEEIGFSDEYEARDAMDYWNSLDDDEMKGFEDARNGDVYGAISDAWDESQAAKPSKEKLSSGGKKKPTAAERDETARLRRAKRYEEIKNEGKGKESRLMWDENGNYKPRPVIEDDVIDEDAEDDEDEGLTPAERAEERARQRALADIQGVSNEEMAARTERARAARERLFSPEGIEKRRLERVKRNKGKETFLANADGTLKEKPGFSSGKRPSETERLAAWKPVLADLRALKSRVNGDEINDGPINGRARAYLGLMGELDEIIANALEERNLDLEGPTDKSRARFERLVNAGDWGQARAHMEGEIASVNEKRSDPVDDGRLSSGMAEWTETEDGLEMDAPDIDGMYRINSEGKGKYSVTRFTDIYRNGGQNALDEDIDRTFSSPSAAKKWAERDYDKIIENMVRDEEYMQDSSRLSSGKSPEYLNGREEGSKQIRTMWRGDSTNKRPYKFDEKNNASLSYQEWYGNVIQRAGAFLEASRDDNSGLYNGMEDAIHEFMNVKQPDATNFRSVDMDAPGGLYDMMRRWGFDPSSPVPLRKQKDKYKRSSSRLSSGKKKAREYTANDIGDIERQGAMDIYGKKLIYDEVYGEPTPDEINDAYGDDMGGRDDREPSYFLSPEEQEDAFYDDTEITDDDIASFLNDLPENERAWFAEESSLPRGAWSGTREEYIARRSKYDLPPPGFPSRSRESDGSRLSSGQTGGGFANPQTSNEIRRIVETNEEIEDAARYVGLDDYETGPTSRAMGSRIINDSFAGDLPESDGEQLDMARELIDEFFPNANSRQKRGMEQTVFGAIARNARESRVDIDWANRRLSSGRKEALNEAMLRESSPSRAFEGYGGDIDFEVGAGGYDDSGPFMDEYLVDLDTVSSADGRDFVGNTVTLNDGRRGVIIDGSDFDIELRDSEYSSRRDTPTPIAGGIDIVITHDENGNLLDTPEYLNDGDEISFDTDNGTGFLIADEDMWKKQNDKENEGFTLIQIDDNKVDDDIVDDLADEKRIAMQPAIDEARAKKILSDLDYRGYGEEYKSKLRRELGQIRQRQFARGEQEKLSSGRRGKPGRFAGRRGELAMAGSYGDPEEESRKDQIWELNQIGHSDIEAEQILEHWWNSVDGDKRDEYIEEFGAGGTRFSEDVAYAASQLWQDYLEAQYDSKQSRNLSSGKRKTQEELNISDREIFERRMSGESLMDTASALGMTREDVRQAEMRHMARERGTLNRPDFDEIESYREDQARMAAEEAEELSMNESIYNRRMGGESLADTAKALGMTREQVRRKEQKHMQLLRDRDREAKDWIEKQDGDTLGSGRKKYVSPLEDMNPGQRLSSGKLDEVYRSVQEQLIEQIQKAETEGGKWEFPWHRDASLPRNAMNNNRPYSGINSLMLMFKKDAMGYETGLWAGFNQWKDKGGTVRKGEKGTLIIIPTVIPPKKDADGNEVKAGSIFFKTGYVFNLDQIDGIDKEQFKMPQLSEEERVAELEQALSEVGAVVNHGGDRAFYRPSTDEITLPPFASFKSKEAYYAVFAHELMHWTGHKDRLNRDHLGDFGSPEYAQEELVAEIASAFFMTAHGLTPEPREDHAQYLASWLKKLKSDPDALKNAFEQAQKAHDYAISLSPSMSKKLGRKVAEAGVIPGNRDGGYGDIGPSLSSGKRNKYVMNPEGTTRTLADEMGAFGDELLTRFQMVRGSRDGDRHYFEDYADLGESRSVLGERRAPNEWTITQGEDGKWSATLLRLEFGNGYTERDWAGVVSDEFNSPEDVANWINDYENTRKSWTEKFKAETDFEKIASMVDEETARRDAEYADSIRVSSERSDRQQYTRMIAEIDQSRLDWSAEDWADEASDIQMELARENGRLSSGVRSRHDETPVEEIGTVSNALKRTDEAGSNSRFIASRLGQVPADKYDFNSIRKNGESVSFTYGGKPRTIYPTGMMAKKGGGIYVVGLDDDAGQYRSYSLHKIEGLVDGADAPYNPTQPGVPRGTPGTRAQRTRNVTSGRLSSGKVRPLDEVRAEIEEDARYESMVVQDAFGGRLGTEKKGEFRVTIPLEDHAEAIQSLDRLVSLRNDLLRSLLDGKRMPAGSYIFDVDKYAPVAEDELDLLMNIDDAVDRIHDELRRREETFSELNDEIDDMKGSISELEDAFRTTTRMGARNIPGPVNFESAMERNIDMADGDDKYAIRLIKSDADSIIEALEKIDDAEDRFSRVTHEEQIAEIKELIDSADRGDLTPQEFASKLEDLYIKNVNGLEEELSDLFNIQTQFEDNGVTPDREDITGTPKDVFSSSNLSNFDMVEGDAAEFSSGRRKRTQGSKRRPMADADRQAFADGVRQRAATIPSKRRPGPSKDEFGTDRLSSGRLRFPDSETRNGVGRYLESKVKIKFGKISENNDRSPDGKWMLDAKKLEKILKDEDGNPLSIEESAKFLGVSEKEIEKMFQDGAGISEIDAYEFIDRAFFGGRDPGKSYETLEAIWGFDAAPYWYDKRRGNQLSRAEYEDYKEEGIAMYPLYAPIDFEVEEQFVGREVSKKAFPVSALAESMGLESDAELIEALTFEADGVTYTPTDKQLKKWKQDGIPTGIVEQLVDQGAIPSAGEVFGEDGTKFDNSIRQFSLWRNVVDAVGRSGNKVKWDDVDEIIGAAKIISRLKTFEQGNQAKYSPRVGKALRYSDDEVQTIVDRLNKKYGLSETVESIKGGGSLSSGRRAARRISNSGEEAVEKLSSGRKNNGAPENITPRMQNEIMGWAENATWSTFAKSVVAQFKAQGFLSRAQWTKLLQLHDNSKRRR